MAFSTTPALGHGGYKCHRDHHGNITVTAADNIQFFAGSRTSDDSTDKRNYAILGMGGDEAEGYTGARDANNNPLDTITVTATNGDIEFVGGEGRRNWAQLGNGGFSNDGDHEANIMVSAGGDIHFIGGQGPADLITDTSRSLDVATWLAGTDRGGWTTLRYRDVRVNVVDFTVTVNGFNFIANGSTVQEADSDGAFTAANIIAKNNVDLDGDTVTDITAGTIVGEINLRTGQVRFFQDLDPTGLGGVTAAYNTGGGSSGAVNVPTTVENQSTNPLLAQAVRGFGGFAADSPHLQATFNNTRGGITDVAEAGGSPFDANIGIQSGTFKLEVPDGTVVEDDGSGHLLVTAAAVGSGLAVGQDVGTISYVRGQIALTAAVNPSGRIGTKATYQTSQKIGADYSYAQLGNGGWNAEHNGTNTDKSNVGNITVTAGGDVRFHAGNGVESYTQLGNGGYDAKGAHSGDIVVNAGGAVEFLAGVGADETDVRSYAQLGHGGYESDGNHFGNISVTTGTGTASSTPGYSHLGDLAGSSIGVLFKAGDREDNYVHMGLGGRSARTGTATTPYGLNGDITVISEGSVSFVGGTGSLNLDGDITGNSDFRLYAQLGHGGYDADAANSSRTIEFFGLRGGTGIAGTEGAGDGNWGHFGDIKVYAGGSVNFIGGDTSQTDPVLKSFGEGYGQYTYTQLGHGGYHASGDHSGNIDVRGGVNASGTVNNASADVYFAAGGPGTSEWNDIRSYAQLGHGGYNASAGELGRTGEIITVVAGRDVIAQGGLGTGNYVLIGHGGSFSDRNAANLDSPVGVDVVRGEIQLSAGRDVKVLAGDYPDDPALGQGIKSSYTWTGAEATRSLDWAANLGSGADFTLQFSRIVPDSIRLEIRLDDGLLVGELVQVGNDIKVNGAFSMDVNGDGNAENFADGEVVGSYNPSSRVVTFTRDVNPGDDAGAPNIRLFFEHADVNRAFAQIGHGGNDSDYLNGDATSPFADDKIVVNAVGSVVLAGGAGSGNYSMIGHGGQNTAGVKNGEILITSGGDTMLSGGTGNDSFVMIGHGGRDSSGSNSGDIKVTSGGKVKVNGGQGVQSAGRDEQFAMIGHGGQGSRGDHFGSITVNAVGDIDFAAGTTVRSSAYLGHGGWDADNPNDENPSGIGNTGGIFAKTTTGDIRFSAGQVVGVSESWTQLGHGGRSNEGNHSGAITVEATVGKINFEAGTGNNNYAQLGHGGRYARGNHYGDISVTAGGNIEFRGGQSTTGSVMYAQLGHGGDDAQARTVVGNYGDISVVSGGDIIFQSGNRDRAWTQLGHGGISVSGTHHGKIDVDAAGMIAFGSGEGAGNWKYSQLGHGGGNASGGDHYGDICVVAGETILLDSSVSTGSRGYTMIGHGGYGASGNQYGEINVLSGLSGANGGISLLGGVTTEANDKFTQIGHGGGTSSGNKTGDIAVTVLHGDLTLTGGTAQYSGALIGHGDSTIGTNGTRTGAMDIYVDGSTVVTDGAPGNSHAYLWHQTTSGIGSVSGDHFSLVTRDLTLPASQLTHLTNFNTSSYLSKMITNGLNLVIGDSDGSGGIDINFTATDLAYNTAADTNIITSGNVHLARNIQTTGGGNVNLIAGWDGTAGFPTMDVSVSCDPVIGIFDFAAAVAGDAVGAAGSETVTIGDGTQTSGIAVGSATGLTGVAGYSVALNGSNSTAGGFAQIGYRPTVAAEPVSGSLHVVSADGSVVLNSGSSTNAPAQIGHGGTGTAATNLTGDICVHAGTTVTLDADNGGGNGSFSQIGHGGVGVAGNHSGEITVVSGVNGTGGVTLTGGALGTNRYAQIGHGGVNATGNLGGEIFVVANTGGALTLTGGAGTNAYAMVGHGDGAGTAGGTRQGGIHYFAGGDATISDGAGTGSQAYLLHHTSNTGGLAGAGNYLGGNGFQYAVNGTTTAPNTAFEGISPVLVSGIGLGDVSVAINGNVDLTIEGPSVQTNNSYDFTILTGGDLRMNLGYQNLGNGDVTLVAGWSGGGPLLGTVDLSVVCDPVITPGALTGVLSDLCANSGANSGMLYIGSASQTQGVAVGSRQGTTTAAGYGMVIEAGDTTANAFSQFGFRPTAGGQGAPGTILVHLKQGGLALNSGDAAGAYTQIGHGGLDAIANGHGADITIEFCDAGDVTFNGGAGAASYAQIGHIGYRTLTGNTATATGNITVTGFRNFDLNAGNGTAAYVQVGHGGFEGDANKTGNITLTGATAPADQGAVTLDGSASGASSDSYAQIGHGGRNSSNTKTGNIALIKRDRHRSHGGAGPAPMPKSAMAGAIPKMPPWAR
ncbi:MAG: hypothetical protein R3F31_03690 [Verrucomicrobiales bacterium]